MKTGIHLEVRRIRKLNESGLRTGGRHVLYWMRRNRRAASNHALLAAAGLANGLDLPVVALERLSGDYPYASDRLHAFALEGVPETAASLKALGIGYVFELERRRGDVPHALDELARDAAAIVTDDYPELVPDACPDGGLERVAALPLTCLAVDSSCIVPSGEFPERSYAAYSLRPKLRKLLPGFLEPAPPVRVKRRFVGELRHLHTEVRPGEAVRLAAGCEVDHAVPPALGLRGGRGEAERRLDRFLEDRLRLYAGRKNEPSAHATSDLSPYLHSGYISSLEVALAVRAHAAERKLMADEFLEQLIVRRELAFNFACRARRLDSLSELPAWARDTLAQHRRDPRDAVYTRDRFERAETADDLWNAAQHELLLRGAIHGYYRMYWGKKILEWSATPEEALETALYLNDRYALDGQDPNGYSNILWCFGLHDRPWPARPVYGAVRSMSRAGMERKTDTAAYIREIEALKGKGAGT